MPEEESPTWRVVICLAEKAEYWLNRYVGEYALHAYLPVNRGAEEWVHIVLLHKRAFIQPKIMRPVGAG